VQGGGDFVTEDRAGISAATAEPAAIAATAIVAMNGRIALPRARRWPSICARSRMLAVRRSQSKIFGNERLRDADITQAPDSAPSAMKKLCSPRQTATLSCDYRASMAAGDLELEQSKRTDWNDSTNLFRIDLIIQF
jgi:hypothetical protein